MHRFFLFCIVLLLAVSTSLFFTGTDPLMSVSFGSFKNAPFSKAKQQPTNIRFVGDVMLARNVETLMKTYGVEYPFSQLPSVATSSFLIGNFEATIPQSHKHTPDFTFAFSVDKDFVPQLHTYGFTHMGLANNHSFDFGQNAFEHTQTILSEASLTPFGVPDNTQVSPVTLSLDDGKVTLVALNFVDKIPTKAELDSYFKNSSDDTLVAYVHWGTEYALTHNKVQQSLAHTLIDEYGVDVIFGHHPHVVQDIELYNGSIIFYSLGNFIFDQYFSKEVQEGLMVTMMRVDKQLQFDLLPFSSSNSLSAPYKMGLYETDIFLDFLQKKSSPALATMIKEGRITISQ